MLTSSNHEEWWDLETETFQQSDAWRYLAYLSIGPGDDIPHSVSQSQFR